MPELLEDIAVNDASVLNGWAAAFNDRAPQIEALPANERNRELLTLAREFTRRASWAVDTAEGWLSELKTRLRDGMGGDKLHPILSSGRTLCGMCRSVVEIAGDLRRLCSESGGEVLSAIGQRLSVVETEIAKIERAMRPPSPEALEKFFQRAEEQLRQGKGLTREQALAAIRKSE
jgi:hypothetical protein